MAITRFHALVIAAGLLLAISTLPLRLTPAAQRFSLIERAHLLPQWLPSDRAGMAAWIPTNTLLPPPADGEEPRPRNLADLHEQRKK